MLYYTTTGLFEFTDVLYPWSILLIVIGSCNSLRSAACSPRPRTSQLRSHSRTSTKSPTSACAKSSKNIVRRLTSHLKHSSHQFLFSALKTSPFIGFLQLLHFVLYSFSLQFSQYACPLCTVNGFGGTSDPSEVVRVLGSTKGSPQFAQKK